MKGTEMPRDLVGRPATLERKVLAGNTGLGSVSWQGKSTPRLQRLDFRIASVSFTSAAKGSAANQ